MKSLRSFILDLYPTTKFLCALFICIITFLLPGYLYTYAIPFVCLFIAILVGKAKFFSNFVIKGLIPIVVMIFLLQSFFYPGDTILWSWGSFSIKQEGIDFSLQLTSKILAIGSALILFFRITKINDLARSLEKLGMSPKATFVLVASFNIIPEMRQDMIRIMDAQRSRGVETEGKLSVRMKAFIPALTPLILSSFSTTEEKAITLESRAFLAKTKKTNLHELEKTINDRLIRMMLVAMLLLIIIWRLFL